MRFAFSYNFDDTKKLSDIMTIRLSEWMFISLLWTISQTSCNESFSTQLFHWYDSKPGKREDKKMSFHNNLMNVLPHRTNIKTSP
jgi:hypothetical protein